MWIGFATVPIGIAGLFCRIRSTPAAHRCARLPVIGISCIVMAALLAIAELYCNHKRTLDHVSLKDAMIVGFAQVGALIPGVSRSGSTLTAALFLDLEARGSRALLLPARPAGDRARGTEGAMGAHKAHLDLHGWSVLTVGLIVASISAFVAIWGLLRILERFSAWPFVAYRAFIGVVLLVGFYAGFLS